MAFEKSDIPQYHPTYKYDGLYFRHNDCFQWGRKDSTDEWILGSMLGLMH